MGPASTRDRSRTRTPARGRVAAWVPDYMVADEIASGHLLRLSVPQRDLAFLRSNLYLLHMPSRYQTKAQQTLMAFLLDKAQAPAVAA